MLHEEFQTYQGPGYLLIEKIEEDGHAVMEL